MAVQLHQRFVSASCTPCAQRSGMTAQDLVNLVDTEAFLTHAISLIRLEICLQSSLVLVKLLKASVRGRRPLLPWVLMS